MLWCAQVLLSNRHALTTFLSAMRAKVDISSWHAPFTCKGEYNVVDRGERIALLWDKQNNPDGECNEDEPWFTMRKIK